MRALDYEQEHYRRLAGKVNLWERNLRLCRTLVHT